jgi:bifunctional DNA-binding transcriptional regulator/antitoxin component of YhaV-PrlF toxin-antitoxin module
MGAVRELVAAIAHANRRGQLALPAEERRALDVEILAIENETKGSRPKISLVTRALKNVRKILMAAAGDATAQLVVQGAILGIEKIIGS